MRRGSGQRARTQKRTRFRPRACMTALAGTRRSWRSWSGCAARCRRGLTAGRTGRGGPSAWCAWRRRAERGCGRAATRCSARRARRSWCGAGTGARRAARGWSGTRRGPSRPPTPQPDASAALPFDGGTRASSARNAPRAPTALATPGRHGPPTPLQPPPSLPRQPPSDAGIMQHAPIPLAPRSATGPGERCDLRPPYTPHPSIPAIPDARCVPSLLLHELFHEASSPACCLHPPLAATLLSNGPTLTDAVIVRVRGRAAKLRARRGSAVGSADSQSWPGVSWARAGRPRGSCHQSQPGQGF